jgi:aspartate/methionine/tyrosine aminotransferase
MVEEFDVRRRLLLDGVRELGLGVPVTPTGAFYILADARCLGDDSLALAFALLERAHVALGPGRDFGEAAEGFLRFSFASSRGDIEVALERLAAVVAALSEWR